MFFVACVILFLAWWIVGVIVTTLYDYAYNFFEHGTEFFSLNLGSRLFKGGTERGDWFVVILWPVAVLFLILMCIVEGYIKFILPKIKSLITKLDDLG